MFYTYSVNDSGRVDVLQSSQDLVHEKLYVVVRQLLRLHDVVQISAHERSHQIDVAEVIQGCARREHIHQVDDLEEVNVD